MSHPVVLLIEDHPIVRAGCRRILAAREGWSVIEAESGEAGLALAASRHPGIVLLDLNLPDMNGLDVLRRLRAGDHPPAVIIFSMYEDTAFLTDALAAGARGYVSKNDDPESLLDAIDTACRGGLHIGYRMAERLAASHVAAEGDPAALTPRERDVLRLLGEGLSLGEIGPSLGVSYRTAASVAAALRVKLRLASAAALIKYAVERAGRS